MTGSARASLISRMILAICRDVEVELEFGAYLFAMVICDIAASAAAFGVSRLPFSLQAAAGPYGKRNRSYILSRQRHLRLSR